MSLGSIVSVIGEKIGELLTDEAKLLYGVKDEVRSLQVELLMMTSFVEDMDEEGHDARTQTVVSEIRKIAYDAEDLIESYIFEVEDGKEEGFIKSFCRRDIRLLKLSHTLRSLFYDGLSRYDCPNLDLQQICQNFRLLRVLWLMQIEISGGTVPTEIGSLIHLRYLRLSDTNISKLPSSIGNLRNLQTLNYQGRTTVRIPDVLWKIEGLKHLDFCTAKVIKGKLKLDTLKSLQTLRGIEGGDWMLKELPLLTPTVQNLEISHITSQEQLEAVFQSPSIKFDRLQSVWLIWDGDVMLKNFKPIISFQHLRELHLHGRIEQRLAGCNIQFPNCISRLDLLNSGFEAEATLANIGKLPSLIFLQLWDKSYVGTEWTCFAGDFPQLEKIRVQKLPNLEEWSIERGAMPHLSELAVHSCKKLRKLPEGLKFITGLQKLALTDMSEEFKKRVEGGGEDAHIIQHVPSVRFLSLNLAPLQGTSA